MVDIDQIPRKPSKNGNIALVRIGGYIDTTTSDEVDTVIKSLVAARQYNIILDLDEVDYISSYGWSIFLSKIKEIRENGGDLKLARMKSDVYEVYKLLEFFWFLNSYETLEEAVKDFEAKKPPTP